MKRAIILFTNLLVAISLFSQNNGIEQTTKKIKDIEGVIQQMKGNLAQQTKHLEELKLELIHQKLVKYAMPIAIEGEQIIHHKAMSLSYNEAHEQPNWVIHMVTKDVEHGNVSRTNDFRKDPLVTTGTAQKDDYWYSGYDRGHLAPSADFRWSQTALSESYFYSNMSPQKPELNREGWAKLENYIRDWAIQNEELFVVTGGVLKEGLPVIEATNKVSIPNQYFKIVVDYQAPDFKGIAFILPNGKCVNNVLQYAVSIDSVQKLTGIDFFPALPDSIERSIKTSFAIGDWLKNIEQRLSDVEPLAETKGQFNTIQAKEQIGKKCKVCGTVVSGKFSKKSGNTYMNLDKKFPNQVFSIKIGKSDRKNFSYFPEQELQGKVICVTGKVEEYKGTPQVIATNEKMIELIEENQ